MYSLPIYLNVNTMKRHAPTVAGSTCKIWERSNDIQGFYMYEDELFRKVAYN